jgi:two-component system response regulator RpaA
MLPVARMANGPGEVSKRRKDGKQQNIPKLRAFSYLALARWPMKLVLESNDNAGWLFPQNPNDSGAATQARRERPDAHLEITARKPPQAVRLAIMEGHEQAGPGGVYRRDARPERLSACPPDRAKRVLSGEPAMKKVFTTGQVAKICKVAPRTVSKWFDSGRLKGYRIPGSQDRRIPREQLIRFLKEHGMPLGELEEEEWHKILVIGAERLFIDRLQEMLPENEDYKYEIANSGFEAGIMAESFHPDTIIIDLSLGRSEALQIASNLRRNPQYEQTLMVALAAEDEADPDSLKSQHHFSEAFKKPFDIALLGERIRTLAAQKRED